MLEHGRALARSRKGGLSYRISASQHRPDVHRQANLAQTPGQALAHPVPPSQRSAAWHGHQHHAIAQDRGKASVARRFQPDLGGKPRQPDPVRSLQARA